MNDDLHHLAAAYALDALEPAERERFEAHLGECAECAADVREFGDTALHLAEAAAEPPPDRLRDDLLAQVAATPQEPRPTGATELRRSHRALPTLVAAAFVLIALGAGVVARGAIVERDRAEDLLSVLAAPDAHLVPLEGADAETTIRVVWSPSSDGAVLVGSGLADPGDGRVYELWVLSADGPRSAGTFEPGDDGRVERRLALPAEPADGWGVTIEPSGGSPQPTGEVLFLG